MSLFSRASVAFVRLLLPKKKNNPHLYLVTLPCVMSGHRASTERRPPETNEARNLLYKQHILT